MTARWPVSAGVIGTVVIAALIGAGCREDGADRMATPAAADDAYRLVAEGALLLDVRTPQEFVAGHIDGAVNIPVDDLGRRLAEVGARDRPVVVYCHSGRRSGIAARLLRDRGYSVTDVGPMTAWRPPPGQTKLCASPKSCPPSGTAAHQAL